MPSIEELLVRFTSGLNDIAHAIRAKTGKEELLSIEEMAAEQDAVFEAGKKAEYDRFWDAAQENGNRTVYDYMFAGKVWNGDTFRPKYDIRPTSAANNMFSANMWYSDLSATLESVGIVLDTSKATRVDVMFAYCSNLERVPTIDASSVNHTSGISNLFVDCKKLHTVERLIIPSDRDVSANNNAFNNCNALANIVIEGVISTNGWNFKYSPLSKASITSVINALSATTSGLTVTLKKTAVEAAFGSTTAAEWTALVATKPNWTISLA